MDPRKNILSLTAFFLLLLTYGFSYADYDPYPISIAVNGASQAGDLKQGEYQKYVFAVLNIHYRYRVTVTPSSGDPDMFVSYPEHYDFDIELIETF